MATYLKDVKCGSKRYYINHNGKDVYCSSSSKTAGTTRIKGLTFIGNEIKLKGKPASDFEICEVIKKSL